MDRNSRAILVAIVVLVAGPLLGHPTPVDFSGEILRWNIDSTSPAVSWAVETDQPVNADFFEFVVTNSAEIWTGVETTYLKLEKASDPASAQITLSYLQSIATGDSASGFAEFDEMGDEGPRHCRIQIAAGTYVDGATMAKTTLHELGHCIGLGHSLVAESIMSYNLKKNSFGLALDDESAVTRLYPKDKSKPKLPPGCSVRGEEPFSQKSHWVLALFLMPWFCLAAGRKLSFVLARKRLQQYVQPVRKQS